MNTQEIQTVFDSLPDWEKEIFLRNNSEQLLEDVTVPKEKPNLDNIETEDIAAWMLDNDVVTFDELLDAVVDDVDELREIMEYSAVLDYESQEEILDEEGGIGNTERSFDYENDEDFPY